jgi:7,8-dihydropterin-6-yl-methyl-4-(beta-D-ribofuranosyl)aminobenzene 5'-phosphate synthase
MRRSKLLWLLAAVVCLGGLCLAHQTPALFIPPTPIIPAQAKITTTPGAPMVTSTVKTTREGQMTTTTSQPVTLTIVYDNHPFDARLKTGWGLACLVEIGHAKILFDTGGDGPALMHNLTVLGIDPRQVDSVVLSHNHDDHTGGLEALLAAANQSVVYAPHSFPAEFKARVRQHAQVVEVSDPVTIAEHVRTTGEMGVAIVEQALIIETGQGLMVVTGCAHPGIVEIVRQAQHYGQVYLILGGFHLKDKSTSEVKAVIAELKRLGVRQVAPCHCTGEEAIQQFKAEFGADFIPVGVGSLIHYEG